MSGSINTNLAALAALRSLQSTSSALTATEKRISTGYVVADALDNGAVFAIAQGIRTNQAGLGSVNTQLNVALGVVSVANQALTKVSDLLTDLRATLTSLSNQLNDSATQANYYAHYTEDISEITNNLNGASYGGVNLLGTSQNYGVIQDYIGNQLSLTAQFTNLTGAFSVIFQGGGAVTIQTGITGAQVAGSILYYSFGSVVASIGNSLNVIGNLSAHINNQITFNNGISDGLSQGLSALVDADLSQESASLQSLQIKQQLATQSLSIANQGPQVLLSLFR